jgi:hypothetical protein
MYSLSGIRLKDKGIHMRGNGILPICCAEGGLLAKTPAAERLLPKSGATPHGGMKHRFIVQLDDTQELAGQGRVLLLRFLTRDRK